MKRKLALLLVAISLLVPTSTFAKDKTQNTNANPNIEAQSAVLLDGDTGKVLYASHADDKLPPASLTKVMTLTVINDEIKKGHIKWDTMVKISKNAAGTGGSKMFIPAGSEISVQELVQGIAIVSGNDAAVAMAEEIAGSTDKFVDMMNQKAKDLGMTSTQFTTVNGLSHTDVTSANDLGLLAYYYIHHYPEMLKIHSTKEFTYSNIKQSNGNPLLYSYEGADGVKTGFVETNYNLIGTAMRNGERLITVTLNSKTIGQRFRTNRALLDYGFSMFKTVNEGKQGEVVKELPVYKANLDKVSVALKDNLDFSVSKDSSVNPKIEINLPKYLEGGLKKGTVIGQEIVKIGGKTITSDIVLTQDLKKAGFFKNTIDSIKLMNGFGKTGLLLLVALAVLAFMKVRKTAK